MKKTRVFTETYLDEDKNEVSQKPQVRLQPERRMKIDGKPARIPSPCNE